MVSVLLAQTLERAKARYGLDVEILDARLNSIYPDAGHRLGDRLGRSSQLRQSFTEVLATGRPRHLDDEGVRYRLHPLRYSAARRQSMGVLAVREPGDGPPDDGERWSDFAQVMVEAELACAERLREEQQLGRRSLGVTAFVSELLEADSEREVAEALIQAAAIWLDVDARIYRRSLTGAFDLYCSLPGVRVEPATAQFRPPEPELPAFLRLPAAEIGVTGSAEEALILPLAQTDDDGWVWVLAGAVPVEWNSALTTLGRIAGARLRALGDAAAEAERRRFEALTASGVTERAAMALMGELITRTGATGGSLTLYSHGESRRLASVGLRGEPVPGRPSDPRDARGQNVRHLTVRKSVGPERDAVVEIVTNAELAFGPTAVRTLDVCARIVQVWLAGATSSLAIPEAVSAWADATSFGRRLEEELERAKRFGLQLAVILVDVSGSEQARTELEQALRHELRGSDVLGHAGGRQVAALLTHTDGSGGAQVARRLRTRLAEAASRLSVSELRLGQATLSAECQTGAALLAEAALRAEPVMVH